MKKMKKVLLALLMGTACASVLAYVGCSDGGNNEEADLPDEIIDVTEEDVPLVGSVCQHESINHVSAVSAGCETAGNEEYWYCSDCNKYFSDADYTVETSLASVTLNSTGHGYGEFVYDYEAKQYVKECANDDTHRIEQPAGTAEYPYLAGNSEQFIELLGTVEYITLSADIDLRATETSDKTYYNIGTDTVIDLNGHTLTTKMGLRVGIKNSGDAPVLTLKNGEVNRVVDSGSTANIATLSAQGSGELEIVNCTVTTNQDTAVSIFDLGKVTATDSSLKGVYYGLASNAGAGDYSNEIYARLSNCNLDSQYAGLLWNIPAIIEIDGCEIKGIGQAVIARGGNVTISNSTLIKRAGVVGVDSDRAVTADESIYPQYENKNWGSGSSVPGYALVVGNRATSYQYATNLTLNNVKVQVEEGVVEKYVYAYGNSGEDCGATIIYDTDCELGEIVKGSNVTVNAPEA